MKLDEKIITKIKDKVNNLALSICERYEYACDACNNSCSCSCMSACRNACQNACTSNTMR